MNGQVARVDLRAATLPAPANNNAPSSLQIGRSRFLPDGEACISPWQRQGAGGRRAAREGWRLTFEPRGRRRIEPLMGWTANDDPLQQVELSFPSLDAAIAYAERQGLRYTVAGMHDASGATAAQRAESRAMRRAVADIISSHLAAAWLEMRYGGVPAGIDADADRVASEDDQMALVVVSQAEGAGTGS